MSDKKGWVKIYRQITEHWVWEDKPFSKGQAWIDLVLLASHKDKKFQSMGKVIDGKRGEIHRSILSLSRRWGWDRRKVRRFLDGLEMDGMVSLNSTTHGTTITIINYSVFQDTGTANEQPMDNQCTTNEQPVPTYKNVKNDKNVKNNKYTCAFEEFWAAYPRKKDKGNAFSKFNARLKEGFSEVELIEAAKKYAAECQENKTEEKYMKHGATFLSNKHPFAEYLDERNEIKTEPKTEFLLPDEKDRFSMLEPEMRDEFEKAGIIQGQILDLMNASDEQIRYLQESGVL